MNATRLARVVGFPRSLPLPSNAKQWTVTRLEANGDISETSDLNQIEEELDRVEESDSEFSPGSSFAEEGI